MIKDMQTIIEAFQRGKTLAVADRILISPESGTLVSRTEELSEAIIKHSKSAQQTAKTMIQLGLNLAGKDALIVGYGKEEVKEAFELVLGKIDKLNADVVISDFLKDMMSINKGDSLPGLWAERIEPKLSSSKSGSSFLKLMAESMRSSVYWKMIDGCYCKFGNDFARGLEYLRHIGFCQVSTNPVLAARAFDEDSALTDELKKEVAKHDDWMQKPEAHYDEIALAATLIALWPNLEIFRPLALYTGLKDYMVSFQLNPNIADQADESIVDARNAYHLATEHLKDYDRLLGYNDTMDPCIVFKVAASDEAARKITTVLNSEGIGTNNTVVYTVAQETQLVLDAFEGKAKATKAGKRVVRTYETNMGGRFVSHLREEEAEGIFKQVAKKAGDAKASELLKALADSIKVDEATMKSVASANVAEKAKAICSFKFLKSLDNPIIIQAAEILGKSADEIKLHEDDLKKAGTMVARRVYWIFYSPENRPKWVSYLKKAYGVDDAQAQWILESMDVLPASKRVPADTIDALGKTNMCHTEFPNHTRAVQIFAEQDGFKLDDYKESVLDKFEIGVEERLAVIKDFVQGYNLTASLKDFLLKEVGIDVAKWNTEGLEPDEWQNFGSVQKTLAEFKGAYDTFASKCVTAAKEVAK
jgi:transaldolase